MKHLVVLLTFVLTLAGCVSSKTIPTVLPSDYSLTCEQLQYELTNLGAKFEEAKDESGVTGKNVALAIVFWPGIIVNEVQANKNEESVNKRVEHLSRLYADRCLSGDNNGQ